MITLADALASPPLAAGDPLLCTEIVGTAGRGVRWVHSSEVLEIASLLRGGELLLTGGEVLLQLPPSRQADFMARLGARGICAVCIETLPNGPRISRVALAAAEAASVPVIELRRVVRFVDITEEINRLIVDSQARLHLSIDRLSQRIAQHITESGPDMATIVHLIADELGAEVRLVLADGTILADTTGAVTGSPAGPVDGESGDPEELPPLAQSGSISTIGADIVLDGQPTAEFVLMSSTMRQEGLAVAADRLRGILELAMAQHHHPSLAQIAQTHLVMAVVEGRDAHTLRRLWRQNGLTPGSAAMAMVVSGFDRGSDGTNLLRALHAQEPRVMAHLRDGTMVLVVPLEDDAIARRDSLMATAAGAMATTPLFGVGGPLVWESIDAHTSFTEAESVLRHYPPHRGSVRDAMDLFDVRALTSLKDHSVLNTYSQALLGNVVLWDQHHGSGLVATLLAWFDAGCNTTLAAQALHIERQSLHKRLARVFDLLGGDPRKTGRIFTLHLAAKYLNS